MQLTNYIKFRFLVFALLSLNFVSLAIASDKDDRPRSSKHHSSSAFHHHRHEHERSARSDRPTIQFAPASSALSEKRSGADHESGRSTPDLGEAAIPAVRGMHHSSSRHSSRTSKHEWTQQEIDTELRKICKDGETLILVGVDFTSTGIVRHYAKKNPEPTYFQSLKNSAKNFVWYFVFPFCVFTLGKSVLESTYVAGCIKSISASPRR